MKILADRIYGFEDETLASAVGKKLSAAGKTAATAESCTGGLVSELLTSVPGSSAYLQGGAVAYSDAAKIKLLGVRSATLKKYGAVSMQSAREMALGARKLFKSDYALSVTGIAGPDGGTAAKPVGLVFFALAGKKGVRVFRRQFFKTRAYIRACAANFILDELRKII